MQRLGVSGAVRHLYGLLDVKGLTCSHSGGSNSVFLKQEYVN